MSWAAICWARALRVAPTGARIPGPVAHLALLLATYHSEVGPSQWPKVAELKDALNVSERSVQNYLDWAETNLLIQRDHRGGRGHASGYTLLLSELERVHTGDGDPEKGCIPDCTLSNEAEEKGEPILAPFEDASAVKGASQIAPFIPDATGKGANEEPERVQTGDEKGATATNGGGTIGGSTPGYGGVPSPTFPSVTTETLLIDAAAPPAKRQRPARKPPPDAPDLTAVCERWAALGFGHLSQRQHGVLKDLVKEHGRMWTVAGLEDAKRNGAEWPGSWARAVIPGLKRKGQGGRNDHDGERLPARAGVGGRSRTGTGPPRAAAEDDPFAGY